MRLSVMLPTRGGGELIEDCLRSVLEQPTDQLELVVSDNANTDQTPEVLARHSGDPRLKVVRQAEPLGVIENWTAALQATSGDYVVLIGDDDYLMPDWSERVLELLDRHGEPDCLSHNGYGFAFPGALAGVDHAFYSDPFFNWNPAFAETAREVPMAERRELVRDFFRFELSFCMNLQSTVVSRRALSRLRAGVFKPPWPDFYAVNALLLTADRWVYAPDRLVVLGISPKSFGRTYQRPGAEEALEYLGTQTGFEGQLPGSEMSNGVLLCSRRLKEDYPDLLEGIETSRGDYVYRQAYEWYLQWRLDAVGARGLLQRLRLLSPGDGRAFLGTLARRLSPAMVSRNLSVRSDDAVQHVWPGMRPAPDVRTMRELARWLAQRGARRIEPGATRS